MSAGVIGVAGVLAACGGAESDRGTGAGGANTGDSGTSAGPAQPPTAPDGGQAAEPGLISTADVPVGGGVVLDREGVVVTQPDAGRFVAFSSTCTHQGCSVAEVSDGRIKCPCHFSEFSAVDGSVQQGPAEAPLPEVPIVVEGDQIRLG